MNKLKINNMFKYYLGRSKRVRKNMMTFVVFVIPSGDFFYIYKLKTILGDLRLIKDSMHHNFVFLQRSQGFSPNTKIVQIWAKITKDYSSVADLERIVRIRILP